MRINIKSQVMRSLFDKAANVMGGAKELTPIINNFMVVAESDKIQIIATDLSLSIIAQTELVSIVESGRAVMPRMFFEIVKEAPDDVLHLDTSTTNGEAKVNCGSAEWQIKLMDVDEYPDIPTSEDINLTFDKSKFVEGLVKVRPAMSVVENRQNLRMVDITDGKIRATDGARLHQVEFEALKDITVQIPAVAVDDLIRLLKASDVAEIGLGYTDRLLVFQIHNDLFIINRIVFEFPDVDKALIEPASRNALSVQVNRNAFREAIKRVRITADGDSNALVMVADDNKLVLGCQDKYGNNSRQLIDIVWKHPKQEILVNHNFLFDLVSVVDSGDCSLLLGENKGKRKAHVVLRDGNTVGILTQLRIQS